MPLVGGILGDRRWSLWHDGRLRRNDLPVRCSTVFLERASRRRVGVATSLRERGF